MTRLSFLAAIASSFAVLAFSAFETPVARAAEPAQKIVRVGFVHPQSPSTAPHGVREFWARLRELGWVDGQNLVIEQRWAEARLDRLPALISEVVGSKVDVLVVYGTPGAIAARKATSTIPIVGVGMGEPLRTGLATSLARPGGNLTGTSVGFAEGIPGKWLELLQEIVPHLSTVAVITNPDSPLARDLGKELETTAPRRGLKLMMIEVRDSEALNRAFEQARRKAQAVLLLPHPILSAQRGRVTALAAKHRLPAMYYLRDYVEAGGLMAYSPDMVVLSRGAADYVDKILRGANPADLPIEQPTQWSLAINLTAARILGLKIPESILVRADEVIR